MTRPATKSDVSSSSQTNSSIISATSMVMLPLASYAVRQQECRRIGMSLPQFVQQPGRVRVRGGPVRTQIPVEQHRAHRRIKADDRLTVLEREGPDDIDTASRERDCQGLRGPAQGRVEPRQTVVNHQRARTQGAAHWI